jgi:hypothetical protein
VLEVKIILTQELTHQVRIIIIIVIVPDHHQTAITVAVDHQVEEVTVEEQGLLVEREDNLFLK